MAPIPPRIPHLRFDPIPSFPSHQNQHKHERCQKPLLRIKKESVEVKKISESIIQTRRFGRFARKNGPLEHTSVVLAKDPPTIKLEPHNNSIVFFFFFTKCDRSILIIVKKNGQAQCNELLKCKSQGFSLVPWNGVCQVFIWWCKVGEIIRFTERTAKVVITINEMIPPMQVCELVS